MWPRVLEPPTRGWMSSFSRAMREIDHNVAGSTDEEGRDEGAVRLRVVEDVDGMRRLAEDLVENEP